MKSARSRAVVQLEAAFVSLLTYTASVFVGASVVAAEGGLALAAAATAIAGITMAFVGVVLAIRLRRPLKLANRSVHPIAVFQARRESADSAVAAVGKAQAGLRTSLDKRGMGASALGSGLGCATRLGCAVITSQTWPSPG